MADVLTEAKAQDFFKSKIEILKCYDEDILTDILLTKFHFFLKDFNHCLKSPYSV